MAATTSRWLAFSETFKQDNFLAKIINYSEFFSSCFFSLTHLFYANISVQKIAEKAKNDILFVQEKLKELKNATIQ